ncbi:hypothetical protein HW115_17625 [Verrucomicrobiaceae bacterium N1E253]|uniref:Uncharacterized protein n=1 Tax=Oceaniferula marina TaxID=2748318 RepID=A0A851GIV9_9BACT|nr:hypothetical protein [Oceaniferula marina]NWK57443.1 hypothetical protein [Oceaniferula marina]
MKQTRMVAESIKVGRARDGGRTGALLTTVSVLLLGLGGPAQAVEVPAGQGQLGEPAEWFTSGVGEFGDRIEYHGQAAGRGKIILTASNGFFDRGIRAKGASAHKDVANGHPAGKPAKGHPPLIASDYAYLDGWDKPGQSMRWHLYLTKPGEVRLLIRLDANQKNPEGSMVVSFAGQKKRIKMRDVKAMKEGLVFQVSDTGKHTLNLSADTEQGVSLGKLSTVDVYGSAIEGAKLLRARWRPAAVHGSYRSSRVEETKMWVMVSKSLNHVSSYSPIVTPFGYYGGSFDADQRFQGGFNFSMWSRETAPLEQQAHLLALGDPSADFSGFGHEGTGVKPRGWSPLASSRPHEVVQSLRVERGQTYNTYYGYFYDPDLAGWKLYCVGRKWVGGRSGRKAKASLWPGSFVEVPGPPQVQRSGDIVRKVVRKGWCLDAEGKWQRLDILPAGKRTHNNKLWGVTKDGWFVFQMGGMEHFSGPAKPIQLPGSVHDEALPDYLSPDKVKQLYQLPVTFAEHRVVSAENSAMLHLGVEDAGNDASAVVYYGEKDCLTFAPRKKSGTERKHSTLKDDRIWPHSQKVEVLKNGINSVKLDDLKPKTKYYYRALVFNERGKMWMFDSGSFTTR